MNLNRRDMLKVTGAGLAMAGLPLGGCVTAGAGGAGSRQVPIALQLWSVRGGCGKEFDKALAQVADMGYDGVEFAGYHKYSKNPEGLKKKLDELGLKAAATHIRANAFEDKAIK